jgi:hypothetical protein
MATSGDFDTRNELKEQTLDIMGLMCVGRFVMIGIMGLIPEMVGRPLDSMGFAGWPLLGAG